MRLRNCNIFLFANTVLRKSVFKTHSNLHFESTASCCSSISKVLSKWGWFNIRICTWITVRLKILLLFHYLSCIFWNWLEAQVWSLAHSWSWTLRNLILSWFVFIVKIKVWHRNGNRILTNWFFRLSLELICLKRIFNLCWHAYSCMLGGWTWSDRTLTCYCGSLGWKATSSWYCWSSSYISFRIWSVQILARSHGCPSNSRAHLIYGANTRLKSWASAGKWLSTSGWFGSNCWSRI